MTGVPPTPAGVCTLQRFSIIQDAEQPRPSLAIAGDAIHSKYGKNNVLKGLNITVHPGVIYGLLGPSGCGKTTLLRCIVGRHKPTSGTIKIYGKVPGQKGFCIPGPGVGFMPQELALYPEITTEETLTYFGRVYQMSAKDIKERISFLADFLDIPDKKKIIKNLSGGQQRRVSFAAALIHKPPLVILDEPTVGVDPLLRKSIWSYLQRLATVDFITIIITTHYVEEARQAHVVGLMRDGRLLAEADPEYLIKKHKVVTLEDVFLKLCIKDMSASEAQEGVNLYDQPLETSEEQESEDDVWVLRKSQRPYNCLPMITGNGSDHKASLLNNPSDPESVLNHDGSFRSAIQTSAGRMGALINKNIVRLKRNIPFISSQEEDVHPILNVWNLCPSGEVTQNALTCLIIIKPLLLSLIFLIMLCIRISVSKNDNVV